MKLRSALAAAAIEKYVSLIVNIVSSMFLARLLTPSEVGVFSIAATLIGFAAIFRDFGANQFVVQAKDLDAQSLGTVWSVQFAIGCLLCLLSLIFAYPIALFYHESQLSGIVLVMAFTFLLTPLGSVTQALLTRTMQFGMLAVVKLSGNLTSAITSCLLAFLHFGALGLAVGSLCGAVATAFVAYMLHPADLRVRPNLSQWRSVCSFGSRMTGISGLNAVFSSAPELLIGRSLGMAAAGIFSRATGLLSIFNRLVIDAVYFVSYAWFSSQARAGRSLEAPFLKGTGYLVVLGWSFFSMCYFLADPIVFYLYGERWLPSVSLIKAMSIGSCALLCPALCSSVLIAAGRVNMVVAATGLAAVALLASLALFSMDHITYFAYSVSIGWCLCAPIWLYVTWRVIRFSVSSLFRELFCGFFIATCTGIGPFFLERAYFSGAIGRPVLLLAGLSCATVGFLISVFAVRHGLSDEIRRALLPLRNFARR